MRHLLGEKKHANVFLSKYQYWVDKSSDFKNKIPLIIKTINKHSNINFDWTSFEANKSLSNEDLDLIQSTVSTNAQKNLIKIISPYIEPNIKAIFGDRIKYNVRVSAQIKGVWKIKNLNDNRKVQYKNGVFIEDKNYPNFTFPTRGHQDLDNNGNRSSHTIIYYFQLTQPFKNSSLLEFGKNNNKLGILKFSDTNGYSNEIPDDILDSLEWDVEGLDPGNIALMSPLTIHRSTKVSEIPRIALNVKIQPTNLDYLEKIYGYDLTYCKLGNSLKIKLGKFYDLLEEASKKNRLLLFEKAVCAFLLKDFLKAESALRDFCLFDISNEQIKKILLGSILRKIMIMVKPQEYRFYDNPIPNIQDLSCAHSIIETLSIKANK